MTHRQDGFEKSGLILAACGGGGGNGNGGGGGPVANSNVPWPLDAASARTVTGGSPPPEISSSEIAARVIEIHAQADTLLMTDLHNPEFAVVGNISTNCRGGTCITSEGPVTLDELTFDGAEYQAVMTRNGITVGQSRAETKNANGVTLREFGYGAWLDHNAFSISLGTFYRGAVSDGYYLQLVAGYSFGNDSGSRPVGGLATWNGVMTGADLEFQNAVQGDAAVTVNFARNNAGVAFTNIKDLGTRSSLPSMEWSGLAIGTDGRFGASDIKATFYGPIHEEVGGVFERDNIVGAFGAKRQ